MVLRAVINGGKRVKSSGHSYEETEAAWRFFTAITPNHLNLCSKTPGALLHLTGGPSVRCFFLHEMAQGVWDIPIPAGIWLIKAGNIWNKLEELSLSQTSKVELSASANCLIVLGLTLVRG